MAERIVLEKDQFGINKMVAYRDRGFTEGHTVGRVTFQINSGGNVRSNGVVTRESDKPKEPGSMRDRQIWEELRELRRMLDLAPDAITDHRGRNLRKLLDRINRI